MANEIDLETRITFPIKNLTTFKYTDHRLSGTIQLFITNHNVKP